MGAISFERVRGYDELAKTAIVNLPLYSSSERLARYAGSHLSRPNGLLYTIIMYFSLFSAIMFAASLIIVLLMVGSKERKVDTGQSRMAWENEGKPLTLATLAKITDEREALVIHHSQTNLINMTRICHFSHFWSQPERSRRSGVCG
jgi:hypothetical protein